MSFLHRCTPAAIALVLAAVVFGLVAWLAWHSPPSGLPGTAGSPAVAPLDARSHAEFGPLAPSLQPDRPPPAQSPAVVQVPEEPLVRLRAHDGEPALWRWIPLDLLPGGLEPTVDELPPPPPLGTSGLRLWGDEMALPVALLASRPPPSPERPASLIPLYAGLALLQALDVATTRAALARGAREANPVMRPIVDEAPVLVAVKAGSTAAVIGASERLWRRHRGAAVATLVAINLGMVAVVAHNHRVVRVLR